MNDEMREKRILEAFALYEGGESLSTLQRIFPDVAVELNQMVEAERMLKEGRTAMRPSPELGKKIAAALVLRDRERSSSLFMSRLWQLAAPIGVAALALMFFISGNNAALPVPAEAPVSDISAFRAEESMNAKQADSSLAQESGAELSLMAAPAPSSELEAARIADDATAETDADADTLYLLQMVSLGLLVLLSLLVLIKHWMVRRG